MRATAVLIPLATLLCATAPLAEESIEAFLERYETALDHGDTRLLGQVYADWTERQAAELERYFLTSVTEFNVELREIEVERVDHDRARIRMLRRDRFTDISTGQRVQRAVRLELELRLREGGWRVIGPH